MNLLHSVLRGFSMPTTNQHNVVNTSERQDHPLHSVTQHEPTVEDETTETTTSNLTTETNRRRGRPPIYASTQERRKASNARRRKLRRFRRSIDSYTSASNADSSTPFNQHPEKNAAQVPNATSIAEPSVLLSPKIIKANATYLPPRTFRRRGRPPIHTSTINRHDATYIQRKFCSKVQLLSSEKRKRIISNEVGSASTLMTKNMNLTELNQSEGLAGLNEKCIAVSSSSNPSSPVSTSTDDIFGDPILSPRLGDDYQAEIPSMLTESEHLLAFECAAKSGLAIPIVWVHTGDNKRELEECCKYTAVTRCTSDGSNCNHLKDEIVGSTLNRNKAYGSPICHVAACKGCNPLPESRVSLWSDDDIRSLLLGFYIFGKNMVQVRRFIERKDMKDVLSFYYGKFYHSDAYHRWACCRKSRSRKCIQGKRMFTGWRQQELLSRMLTGLSKEVQDSLLEATKDFNEGRSSLEQLVFTLKAAIGIRALIDAAGIGKGKQDLTGFTVDSGRNNQPTHHSRREIPAGKACSGFSSSEIIDHLTGNFRLSKARSNDLFWEAVWPRLLARGWHSERPKNICSKKTLVFLVPGIRKFSRSKLVKGGQYFDSVAEVLNKVAADPRLLELQSEGAVSDDHRQRPPYLRPCFANSDAADLMKFTVVDTSLFDGAAASSELRELPSIPFVGGANSDSSMDSSEDVHVENRTQTEQPACPAPSAKRRRLSSCKRAMRNACHAKPCKALESFRCGFNAR
ncbi:hypothetical protein KSP40_PGU015821 [Platanthera guangdongensis]|uniref:SANT domain-containing protein n=1 Tax=Platanthera guangdongensis TaxID=2320717 RepID=A0ABR2M1Z1_9ASPA